MRLTQILGALSIAAALTALVPATVQAQDMHRHMMRHHMMMQHHGMMRGHMMRRHMMMHHRHHAM
jgi:hypothetical protein